MAGETGTWRWAVASTALCDTISEPAPPRKIFGTKARDTNASSKFASFEKPSLLDQVDRAYRNACRPIALQITRILSSDPQATSQRRLHAPFWALPLGGEDVEHNQDGAVGNKRNPNCASS